MMEIDLSLKIDHPREEEDEEDDGDDNDDDVEEKDEEEEEEIQKEDQEIKDEQEPIEIVHAENTKEQAEATAGEVEDEASVVVESLQENNMKSDEVNY